MRVLQGKLRKIEAILAERAPKECQACRSLRPGGPGGPVYEVVLWPLKDDPSRHFVFCKHCSRCASGAIEHLPTGVILIRDPVPGELPV